MVKGKNAKWKPGTLVMNSWTGEKLVYKPIHNPWKISMEDPLTTASIEAYEKLLGMNQRNLILGFRNKRCRASFSWSQNNRFWSG